MPSTTGPVGGTGTASALSETGGRTMKAIVRDRYGAPDVLQVRDVPVPEIGDDEVLVRVRAAGLDRGAWHVMTGCPT